MPGPTSIQSTLIIKHALAVRPVNSRVPCYFRYKNFQGIAERESKGREGGDRGWNGERAALKFYKGCRGNRVSV